MVFVDRFLAAPAGRFAFQAAYASGRHTAQGR